MLRSKTEGFIRSQTEVVKSKLLLIISDVTLEKQRVMLVKDEQEVAAIIAYHEFEHLELVRYDIKYGQFQLEEEYHYDNESAMKCISINQLEHDFEQTLDEVMSNHQTFALMLPTPSCKNNQGNFGVGEILMNINKFWIPDYWLLAKSVISKI